MSRNSRRKFTSKQKSKEPKKFVWASDENLIHYNSMEEVLESIKPYTAKVVNERDYSGDPDFSGEKYFDIELYCEHGIFREMRGYVNEDGIITWTESSYPDFDNYDCQKCLAMGRKNGWEC